MRQKLVAGNWKMNGLSSEGVVLASGLSIKLAHNPQNCEILLCPPATLLSQVRSVSAASGIKVGGQDCHPKESGAYTGDVSAAMIKDLGASYTIVGHSERRQYHNEDDLLVKAKAEAILAQDMVPIICVGESEMHREAGQATQVVTDQIKAALPDGAAGEKLVIAYEPIWAIGTGKSATSEDVREMHAEIRTCLKALLGEEEGEKVRILYGGSVKPDNASDLLAVANVDGALVGGASLDKDSFWGIITAASELQALQGEA